MMADDTCRASLKPHASVIMQMKEPNNPFSIILLTFTVKV